MLFCAATVRHNGLNFFTVAYQTQPLSGRNSINPRQEYLGCLTLKPGLRPPSIHPLLPSCKWAAMKTRFSAPCCLPLVKYVCNGGVVVLLVLVVERGGGEFHGILYRWALVFVGRPRSWHSPPTPWVKHTAALFMHLDEGTRRWPQGPGWFRKTMYKENKTTAPVVWGTMSPITCQSCSVLAAQRW